MKNAISPSSSWLAVLGVGLGLFGVACGGEPPLVAEFTSDVVQLDTCRLVGDDDRERCVRDEVTSTLKVTVIEDDFDRLWLLGVPREGEDDRRILGTRDSAGGFLFEERTGTENAETGCDLDTHIQLSLSIDPDATAEQIGADPCVALLGRETRTVTTSAGCDDINDPPARIVRINRRRWEPAGDCGMDATP